MGRYPWKLAGLLSTAKQVFKDAIAKQQRKKDKKKDKDKKTTKRSRATSSIYETPPGTRQHEKDPRGTKSEADRSVPRTFKVVCPQQT